MSKAAVSNDQSPSIRSDETRDPQNTSKEISQPNHATDEYVSKKGLEGRIRLKMDLAVMPLAALIFLFCFLDRSNIGNARLAGLERDLGMKGYDFNSVNTILYVAYIIFEIPSTMLCKIVGPAWWLPLMTICFGVLTIASAYVNNYAQLAACRFFLGAFEAGIMPGLAYYLSRFYRHDELTFRLALYIVMAPLAGAFGGLLASAILRLNGFGAGIPARSWRAIFALEGIMTVGVGLLTLVLLTDRPDTARFLTQDEREVAVTRLKQERVGTTVVLDKISKSKLLKGAFNPATAMTSIIFMFGSLSVQGIALFSPTLIRSLYPHESVIRQQLLTVPPYAVGAGCLLLMSFLSWKTKQRQLCIMFCAVPMMIGYLVFLVAEETQTNVRYAGVFLMASTCFILGPLCHGQTSANVSSDTARNMAISICMMFGNIGSLVSTWSFLSSDAPKYPIGCGLNFATSTLILILAVFGWFWMRWDNKRRDYREGDAELMDLSTNEIEQLEWKHPSFRWRP